MPRISINEMSTYHWSLLEDVTGYGSAGINGIGVWRRKLSDFGEERGVELLRESDLTVTSLWSAGGFTGSDGQTFREAVDDALDALRLAVEVQAGCLVVVSGARAGHTYNHARRLLCDALRKLGDAAGHYGLAIALQPMHRLPVERWSMLTTLDAALDAVSHCNHPRVGLVFDTYHLWQERDLLQRIPEVVPWIRLAALADSRSIVAPVATSDSLDLTEDAAFSSPDDERCIPGHGVVPLAQIVAALEAAGYEGAYELQLTGERNWQSKYPLLLAECRAAMLNMAPQLCGGRDFTPPTSRPATAEPVNPIPATRLP